MQQNDLSTNAGLQCDTRLRDGVPRGADGWGADYPRRRPLPVHPWGPHIKGDRNMQDRKKITRINFTESTLTFVLLGIGVYVIAAVAAAGWRRCFAREPVRSIRVWRGSGCSSRLVDGEEMFEYVKAIFGDNGPLRLLLRWAMEQRESTQPNNCIDGAPKVSRRGP